MVLMTCGCPVTMLGDHLQLPPVCEVDEEAVETGITDRSKSGDPMRYVYMWDQSALFSEGYIHDKDTGYMEEAYLNSYPPRFDITKQVDLTASHRFGNNLAKMLDECVYHNGIKGLAKDPLHLICIDTYCKSKVDRENMAEVAAVGRFLDEFKDLGSYAILTPYKVQVKELEKAYPELKDNILSVHKS